jgi:hypothetical protein
MFEIDFDWEYQFRRSIIHFGPNTASVAEAGRLMGLEEVASGCDRPSNDLNGKSEK